MKSLIVGMGIGNLYKEVLTNLGAEIVTVDLEPGKADYTSVETALESHEEFDTVHICTPNFTHREIAEAVAPHAKIVFVEKPGFKTWMDWDRICAEFPGTRFMMVKNNQWRENIKELRRLASNSVAINLFWINKNRVPGPGTWFTTKELAFGGVSRDLMTHLLSLFQALNYSYATTSLTSSSAEQRYSLEDVSDTEYGTVKADGTYDVDDVCKIIFQGPQRTWNLIADWRSNSVDERAITFEMVDGSTERFELGLCPAEAYQAMIKDAVDNLDNETFWAKQLEMDIWIHTMVGQL
jgi:predicted dehydrogenase